MKHDPEKRVSILIHFYFYIFQPMTINQTNTVWWVSQSFIVPQLFFLSHYYISFRKSRRTESLEKTGLEPVRQTSMPSLPPTWGGWTSPCYPAQMKLDLYAYLVLGGVVRVRWGWILPLPLPQREGTRTKSDLPFPYPYCVPKWAVRQLTHCTMHLPPPATSPLPPLPLTCTTHF